MTDYAVVEHGGKQYRVSPGDVLLVERTVPNLKAGDELRFDRVMMVSQSDAITVGKPIVDGVSVLSQVVERYLWASGFVLPRLSPNSSPKQLAS